MKGLKKKKEKKKKKRKKKKQQQLPQQHFCALNSKSLKFDGDDNICKL